LISLNIIPNRSLFALFFLIGFIGINTRLQAQSIDTLIDIGSYKLHFKIIKGKGAPVIFEAGGALNAEQWNYIANQIHKTLNIPVISYDRQGFGRSGLDTANYNILNEIIGFETGLQRLGYANTNVVLVCHSLGAFYCRLYAARHPKQVKGIVMLDPRIPSYADIAFARDVFSSLDRKQFKYEDLSLYYVLAKMESNSNYIRLTPLPAHLPVLDIMADQGPFTSKKDNDRFKSDQRSFVKSNASRTLIFAKGSSHNIPHDKPEIVIAQILQFYKRVTH